MNKHIILLLTLLCQMLGVAAEDKVYISDFSIKAGETKRIELCFDTEQTEVTRLQGTVTLPEGLTVVNQSSTAGLYVWMTGNSERTGGATVSYNPSTGGVLMTTGEFTPGTGAVGYIDVKASTSLAETSTINIKDFKVKKSDGTYVNVASDNCTVTREASGQGGEQSGDVSFAFSQESITLDKGQTTSVDVTMTNSVALTGMQATLTASDGLTITGVTKSSRIVGQFRYNTESGLIMHYGSINGNEGTVFTVGLKLDDDFTGSSATLTISDLAVTTASAQSITASDITASGALAVDGAFTLSVVTSEHGTVTFKVGENTVTAANEGDLVTMTITPDNGYVVGSVSANAYTTWAGSRRLVMGSIPMLGDVTLTPVADKENTWTFTMPATNVELKVGYLVASYLFLSKEALKDKASITVKDGETTVEFDDDGKSTTTVTEGSTVTATNTGTKKILGVDAEIYNLISIPLTMEVTAPGKDNTTIRINIDGTLETGMKYSVNGGEKKIVTASTNIEGLNVGDKVQFYGNGIETQMYGNKESTGALVKLAGGSAKVKVYGNIMSLIDETGFATTTLPLQQYAFYSLFINNTNLTDASGLLLPATTLAANCYERMFKDCSYLTAGPQELPATTAASKCYCDMFSGCSKLTAAPKIFMTATAAYVCSRMFQNCSNLKELYIKAAYARTSKFNDMFSGATATGAVLHTTSANAGGWNGKCGSWTVQGDWPATAAPTTWTVSEPISVDWNATSKTGTFTMPGNDVELIPNVAPTAQFAVVNNMAQLPAAAEGIYAATSAPLITAGTAVEGQGKLMYLATTDYLTADQAKAASGWSETVPTAEGFADNTMIAYVWYYIQATDAYNDSEPVCIPITFLDNKFNLTLNAANAYTIDATTASKGTVTVAGTNKTSAIAEGKLNAVTVGSEVKLTAATGYKFRKVEVTNDSKDPLATPMTIKAMTDGTIVVNRAIRYGYGIKYSVNGGDKSVMDQDTYTINVNAGDEVQFYGNGTNITDYGYINEEQNIDKTVIGGTAKMKVFGNIMSLLDEENFATNTELPNPNQSSYFWKLFNENTNLTDASGLLLPSTTLATYCYGGLFYGCTSLTAGPKLPATQMAKDCYSDMFNGCTSLTKAPELPATELAEKCYFRMFRSCTSLTSVYVKAGYAAAQRECSSMFDGTSTAAVLHTTSGSQSSWETMMGTGKTWDSWTVSADWTE